MGLAISKALVVAHRGTIWARSDGRGHGATLCVRLPTTPRPQQAKIESPPREVSDQSPAGLKILLVEDHQSTLAMLCKLVEAMGHRVTPASSVASALRAMESDSFDLLISDLGLPDGVGYDLMQQARAKYDLRGIALSGYGMDSDVQRSLEAGFLEHITKPIDMDTLRAAIARAAGRGKALSRSAR